jgi:hypothetical protein
MNALHHSIIGQEMGSDDKEIAFRNAISNFLLCFVFEMDATVGPLPPSPPQKKLGTQKTLGFSKVYCEARIVLT